jgi:hypothetical protein
MTKCEDETISDFRFPIFDWRLRIDGRQPKIENLKSKNADGRWLLLLFFFAADCHNFAPAIVTAGRAYGMWKLHLTTVVARDELHRLQKVVCAAAVCAAPRKFALW